MRRWSNAVRLAGVAAAALALLSGCAVVRDAVVDDPDVGAELALREDAREAAEAAFEPPADARDVLVDTAAVAHALGGAGRLLGRIYEVRVAGTGGSGIEAVVAFHPAGGGRTAITGDVSLSGAAAGRVERALAGRGIKVTPVTDDHGPSGVPRTVLRVWAVDEPVSLAHRLRAAIDQAGAAEVSEVAAATP